MSVTRIIAVRHGETRWNRLGKQQGHCDSPLSPLGVRQARLVARALDRKEVDVIYSSDLGRAAATAAIIAKKLRLKVNTEPGLRERKLGLLEGLTMAEFKKKFPVDYRRLRANEPDYVLPGGESARQSSARLVACVNRIVRRHRGKKILFVMHGGNLSCLFRHVLGIPLTRKRCFSLVNAAVNRFTVANNIWRLETWGELSHLKNMDALDDF